MGYDIKIGKIVFDANLLAEEAEKGDRSLCLNRGFMITLCEGEEPAGLTSHECTINVGEPYRQPSYTAWGEFMRSCPPLAELSEEINPQSSDGWCYLLNNSFVKEKILQVEPFISGMNKYDADRARWLCFWVKEAIARYGNEAAIGFW